MERAIEGVRQIAEFANPSTLKRLREARALDPRGLLALARTFPWLLGRGPSLGLMAQMHALVLSDKPALHDRNGTLTWSKLDERANQAANLLWRFGVRANDRVATVLRNGREVAELALGAQKLGVVLCPLNTWAKPKELEATLRQADPVLLVYDTAHADAVQRCAPEELPLLFVGETAEALDRSLSYEDQLAEQPASPPFPFTTDPGSPKVVIHTSGTTGTPKGASRGASAAGLGALANLLSVVPYRRDDVIFCPAPLFHSFGLATFTFATALGATLVLPDKFEPERSLALIEEHRATAASFVPVMIRRILTLDDDVKARYDLSSLRIVLASGSAMSEGLRRDAMELFGPVLYDLYGSTEVGWVAIATPEDMRTKPKTVGRPVPGIDVAIYSETGERLPPGGIGEIYVRSAILFEGYTSGDSKKQKDGYLSIGDLGRLDDEGYLFVEGRADDMIVVGGENIYPTEVEQVIEHIDGVDDVAVFGVPDEEYGQVLSAFIVGSADPDRIRETCESELASYKVPKKIEKLDELPRTATGKVVKRELIDTTASD